jgi:cytochrome c oxidase subunit 2
VSGAGLNRIAAVGLPNRSRRSLALAALAGTALALIAASPAFADWLTPESGGSPNADKIDTLYKTILVVAVVVFVLVEGLLAYCFWKFRASRSAIPAQIHGNTRLEIGWTVAAALILVVLATITFIQLPGIRNPPNSGANGLQLAGSGVLTAQTSQRLPPNGKSLNICVNGQQYIWRYTYAKSCKAAPLDSPYAYQEMVVPTDTTVTLDIVGQDVAHSWWVPKLGGKFDAVPGYHNYTWFKIPKPGVFTGNCAEFCGRNHANMTAIVRAVPPAVFEQWLARQKRNIAAANQAAAQERAQLESQPGTAAGGGGPQPQGHQPGQPNTTP